MLLDLVNDCTSQVRCTGARTAGATMISCLHTRTPGKGLRLCFVPAVPCGRFSTRPLCCTGRVPANSRWKRVWRAQASQQSSMHHCPDPNSDTHRGPRESLDRGEWFKMICGASSQDLPRIRNLTVAYALAGVDCIDISADAAVVAAVHDGLQAASKLRKEQALDVEKLSLVADPWVMISVNDDEDPHFRKASFDTSSCPTTCHRPCETVCPANAIDITGVIADVCYGCGRCEPVCPSNIIENISYVHSPSSIARILQAVDAIEIHTRAEHYSQLRDLWNELGLQALSRLRAVALSFPEPETPVELRNWLTDSWSLLSTLPESTAVIWQADGRPMSGDIGRGAARPSVEFSGRLLAHLRELGIPGYVQPAGGTNAASATLLEQAGLLRTDSGVSGIAVGGYARKYVEPVSQLLLQCLDSLALKGTQAIEDDPAILEKAVVLARELVGGFKPSLWTQGLSK